jgi:hypothetical protein
VSLQFIERQNLIYTQPIMSKDCYNFIVFSCSNIDVKIFLINVFQTGLDAQPNWNSFGNSGYPGTLQIDCGK